MTTAIAQVVRDKPGIQLIVFLRDADAQLNDCVRTCPPLRFSDRDYIFSRMAAPKRFLIFSLPFHRRYPH